jgi:hypothetical protein
MQRYLTMAFANFVKWQKIQKYILMHAHLGFGENIAEIFSIHH